MEDAIEFLKKAVALGTTDPVDYSVLGELLLARHRPTDAIGVLRAGLSLDPIYIPYYELLANSYMKTGDVEHAGEIINQGLQQFPENHVLRELQEKIKEGGRP
jgi:predicted Zn-dependent protease